MDTWLRYGIPSLYNEENQNISQDALPLVKRWGSIIKAIRSRI